MDGSVWILLVLLLAMAAQMGGRLWGKSFDELFADQDRAHHHVHAVLARHPQGGTWRDFRRWSEEDG